MLVQNPFKQILMATREYWDRPETRPSVRENFLRIIACGTTALGAEIYASGTERKLVYHTCKSRFCPSCGHRATQLWQAEIDAALPDVTYVNINFTMPRELAAIFQRNRRLLHDLPALGAAAIQHWARARYGVRVLILVVQQTFGGLLNFHPHLHILVSAGGLRESGRRWITQLRFDKQELMRVWRYAVVAYLSEAQKAGVLGSALGGEEVRVLLEAQYKRTWVIFLGRVMSKAQFVRYAGRYIRRPPIAEYRLERISDREVEYLVKDTRKKLLVKRRYSNEEFVDVLKDHVPERFEHGMRYFGLLSPRSKHLTFPALFALLGQKKRTRPRRLSWADSLYRHFGVDPLVDSFGKPMRWIGRQHPAPR
jgi:Putative transposase/Transposase zinc-binding domain